MQIKLSLSELSPFTLISFSFFLSKLVQDSGTMGMIVYGALAEEKSIGTAVIVAVQACAALTALMVASYYKKFWHSQYSELSIVILSSLFAFLIAFGSSFSILWLCSIFIKQCLGILLIARFQALVRTLSTQSYFSDNRRMQLYGVLAMTLGWSFGPLITANLGYKTLYLVDGIIMFILSFFILNMVEVFAKTKKLELNNSEVSSNPIILTQLVLYPVFIIFCTYLIVGVFQVVEVPYLLDYVKINKNQISLIFGVAALTNFFSTKFINLDWLQKRLVSSLLVSSILLILLTSFYLRLSSLMSVLLLIVCFGAINGLFTLSYTSIAQTLLHLQERTTFLLYVRFAVQLAILASIGISLGKNIQELQKILLIVTSLIMAIYAFLIIKLRKASKFHLKEVI